MSRPLGQRFQELRIEKGYTLDTLAQAVSPRTSEKTRECLSRFENGQDTKTDIPSLALLVRLAECLGVDLIDFANFPEAGTRSQLIEGTRDLSADELNQLLDLAQILATQHRNPSHRPE